MVRIYLLRHGFVDNPDQVFYGPEFRLSAHGKIQIEEIGNDMKTAGVVPAAVRYSPFLRTTDSMEQLTRVLPCADVHVDERLVEWKVGEWLDRPLADFYAATNYDTPEWHFDSLMETHAQMAERVRGVIEELRDAFSDRDSIIISHREPIVSALLQLLDRPFSEVHEFECPVACAWEVVYEGTRLVSVTKAFDRSMDGHPHTMG